ncbi:MAG: outer membrane protein assembly factor BamB family protein, partial [Planctomycetota bacterium]
MKDAWYRCVLGLCLACGPVTADDWGSWRGPDQNGAIEAPGLFREGPFALQTLWSRTLGSGYAGISVADGVVVTMYAEGAADLLAAFDAGTGEERWRFELGEMYRGHDGGHDGPPSTPVVAGDAVYALGADGRLIAVTLADGRVRWSVSLAELLDAPAPFWGFTTTPLVVDDVVIVQAGGSGARSVAAFDVRDGALRWTAGRGVVDYRSPVCAELNGRRQAIVCTIDGASGLDPTTGAVLWTVPIATRMSATPLVIGTDRVLLPGQSGAVLLHVPADGGTPL